MPSRYYDVASPRNTRCFSPAAWPPWGSIRLRHLLHVPPAAYDCIVHDAALQELPVIFCMDAPALAAGRSDPPRLFDISYIRSVPNCIGMAPQNEDELVDMMFTATQQQHPCFIRYPRGPPKGSIKEHPSCSKSARRRSSRTSPARRAPRCHFPARNMLGMGRAAAAALEQEGCDVALINPRFTKPIDAGTTGSSARGGPGCHDRGPCDHGRLWQRGARAVQREAHHDTGGRIGWPDKFIEHATTVEDLRRNTGSPWRTSSRRCEPRWAPHRGRQQGRPRALAVS